MWPEAAELAIESMRMAAHLGACTVPCNSAGSCKEQQELEPELLMWAAQLVWERAGAVQMLPASAEPHKASAAAERHAHGLAAQVSS
jgi:hypothetical protein